MRRGAALVLSGLLLAAVACSGPGAQPASETVVGAIYPLSGPQKEGGEEEFGGVQAALQVARSRGVAGAVRVRLQLQPVETPEGAARAVDTLVDRYHVPVIIGTYGSELAEAAAAEADRRHVVYWETGAVSDGVTLNRSWVFRTVATGSSLGRIAADFAGQLKAAPPTAAIVHVDDVYGNSVAAGEVAQAKQRGIEVVANIAYDPARYDAATIVRQVLAPRPGYFWDVSYLPDGIAMWRAMLAATPDGARPVTIGTSSAFCMDAFGSALGSDAVGVFAADKPNHAVNPSVLTPDARDLLARATAAYAAAHRGDTDLEIPTVAGFVGMWSLLHDVLAGLPAGPTPEAIRSAAYRVDVPAGGAINGGGIRFSPAGQPDAGQNLRAATVVGEWLAPQTMRVVFPDLFATNKPVLTSPAS